ncbi:MAG: hypothetical protein R3E08_07760 [Thiotrichaceae bacterium]
MTVRVAVRDPGAVGANFTFTFCATAPSATVNGKVVGLVIAKSPALPA